MFPYFRVPEARHVKAQDKVLGAIGFEHESRRDDTSANVGFNRATIQIAENGSPSSVTVAFNGAVPPGLEFVFVADPGLCPGLSHVAYGDSETPKCRRISVSP